MNGSWGVGPAAFDKLFAMWPWLAVALGLIALVWIASNWRDA